MNFFISPITTSNGKIPITKNKRIAGIKKLEKGEVSNIDNGVPSSLPEGSIINSPPPTNAPKLKNPSKKIKKFLAVIILDGF